jgi:repressor of nif and glnA expression
MVRPDGGNMGKEQRMAKVLELLQESDLALPPGVIFRNLKYRGVTFERRTLDNYLEELVDDGMVQKVEPDGLTDGELNEIPKDESGYYVITEAGLARLEE